MGRSLCGVVESAQGQPTARNEQILGQWGLIALAQLLVTVNCLD